MKQVIVRYKEPVTVEPLGGYNIFGSYPDSSLPNTKEDTIRFIEESVAHPGLVAILKQALVNGFAKYDVDESIRKDKNLLSAIYECEDALKSEGFEISVSAPSVEPFSVNGVAYETLVEAFENLEDGSVIKLACNSDTCGISVAEGKNFTLDLNGYELSVQGPGTGSPGTETCGLRFLKDSNVTIKNGILSSHEGIKMLIQNYSNLTLDNVILVGSDICLYLSSNNFGDTVYKNGTTFNVVGANNVAFDAYYGLLPEYDDGVHVTVADSTVIVNGPVEFGKSNRASEEHFEERTSLTVPADMNLVVKNMPEGFDWVVDGNTKHIAKI